MSANRRYRYPWGRSRIVYIGTTKRGAHRVASSAAKKGEDLLFEHGIREVEFSVVTCGKLQNVATWKKLERALLIKFRERFGAVPKGNVQGKKMKWDDEKDYFSQKRLDAVLEQLG